MRKKLTVFILFILFVPSFCLANEFIVGKILEIAPDDKLVQVCNSMYKVESLFIDDGTQQLPALIPELQEGSIVQIYPTIKTSDYWSTDKIIILKGKKKQHMVTEYGVDCNFRTNQSHDDD